MYDSEKYRLKREKVLRVTRSRVSFGSVMTLVALIIIIGMGAVIIPRSMAYLAERNLDDAIYKLKNGHPWPETVISELTALEGVKTVSRDKGETRLVITFDRTLQKIDRFSSVFEKNDLETFLLNRLGHSQRKQIIKEEKEL